MDAEALAEFHDQHRWLMNNGLVNEGIKNQLMFYGSIVHKDVRALEVGIDLEKKLINYSIFCDAALLKKIAKYQELSKSRTLFGMWRFKRLLNKEGNLNFNHLLNKFVKDYCGPKWSAKVEVKDIATYVEGMQPSNESATNSDADQQPYSGRR